MNYNMDWEGRRSRVSTAHLIFSDGQGFIHRQVLTGFLRGQPTFLYRCGENSCLGTGKSDLDRS
ncbi:MAG: hypothetical protein AB4352_11320 [Hormoscilla sp.]